MTSVNLTNIPVTVLNIDKKYFYTGQMDDYTTPNGFGVLTGSFGKYQGQFVHGTPNGYGQFLKLDGTNYQNYLGNFGINGKENGDGIYEAWMQLQGSAKTHLKIRGQWKDGIITTETCWEYWTVVNGVWVQDQCHFFFSSAHLTKLDIHDLHVPKVSRIVDKQEKLLEKMF